MAECAHAQARGWRHLKRPLRPTASQTHDAALWMEEAAEPEQGVVGITQLIWGQTEDTCAPPRRPPGLESHAEANERRSAPFFFFLFFCIFWGGCGTCLKAVPSPVQAAVARRLDKFRVWCVWARGAPSRPCRLNDRRRTTAECDCSCAVRAVGRSSVCVNRGRRFKNLRERQARRVLTSLKLHDCLSEKKQAQYTSTVGRGGRRENPLISSIEQVANVCQESSSITNAVRWFSCCGTPSYGLNLAFSIGGLGILRMSRQ